MRCTWEPSWTVAGVWAPRSPRTQDGPGSSSWEKEISKTEPERINVMFTWKTTDNIQHVLKQHF